MQFLIDHYDEIIALLGATWTLVSGIVALTPSTEDDAFLARVAQRVSFFAPKNMPGIFSMPGKRAVGILPRKIERPNLDIGPFLALAIVVTPFLGGCARAAKLDTLLDFVRGASCAVCDKLGGEAGCEERAP